MCQRSVWRHGIGRTLPVYPHSHGFLHCGLLKQVTYTELILPITLCCTYIAKLVSSNSNRCVKAVSDAIGRTLPACPCSWISTLDFSNKSPTQRTRRSLTSSDTAWCQSTSVNRDARQRWLWEMKTKTGWYLGYTLVIPKVRYSEGLRVKGNAG